MPAFLGPELALDFPRPRPTPPSSGLLFSLMPQGDLFISKVFARIGAQGLYPGLLHLGYHACLQETPQSCPVPLGPWSYSQHSPFALCPQAGQVAPSWALSANSSLWFWVWARFCPRIPQGNCQLLTPFPQGWGSAWPSDLCLSRVWGWGSFPFPALGSLRVASTGQLQGIAFCLVVSRGPLDLYFLVSLASVEKASCSCLCLILGPGQGCL